MKFKLNLKCIIKYNVINTVYMNTTNLINSLANGIDNVLVSEVEIEALIV